MPPPPRRRRARGAASLQGLGARGRRTDGVARFLLLRGALACLDAARAPGSRVRLGAEPLLQQARRRIQGIQRCVGAALFAVLDDDGREGGGGGGVEKWRQQERGAEARE